MGGMMGGKIREVMGRDGMKSMVEEPNRSGFILVNDM